MGEIDLGSHYCLAVCFCRLPKMADRQMKYPYTTMGQLSRFPFKHYFQHGRGFRFVAISVVLFAPLWIKMGNILKAPANQAEWVKIRADYYHDHFAPPKP